MTDKEMARPPGFAPHGKRWRIVKRIPNALLPHYAGETHLRYPIDAANESAARVIGWRWHAETEETFERILKTGSANKTRIPADEVSRLVSTMLASALGADEEGLLLGGNSEPHSRSAALAEIEAGARKALGDGDLSAIGPVADDWLQSHGYALAPDSEDYRRVLLEFAKGLSQVLQALKSRRAGEWVDTPAVPPLTADTTPPTAGVPLLSAVVSAFIAKADKAKPMFKKTEPTLRLFLEVTGDKPVSALRQTDIDDFFALLCKLPPRWRDEQRKRGCTVSALAVVAWPECIAPKTLEDSYIAALRPFLGDSRRLYGDQGFPMHLTTDGIKYTGTRKGRERAQRALRPAELVRLFNGPECAAFAADPAQAHRYWLPLLGLYTGARVNEVCQLNPQCDIREEGGIWLLDITEESEGDSRVSKSVKNETSRRPVPVHPELLRLGFLRYVERVRAAGHALLFPEWAPSGGKASAAAAKWFRGYLAALGLRDETPRACILGFHCFRSTFLARAYDLGVLDAEAVTGHADAKVSAIVRGYRGAAGLDKRKRILEQITFDIDPPKPA
ncbi:MAG: site-specific integrase [Thiobacillus sp.]|nr:site-specific integrase [Thiobacillus sp.]MBC2731428.1 site-specific integrase [Thiobacillus sp.]MBC2740165.1 site-specific integrase [Thiobacillus sp.]MBC2758378.1 site-specific integrase [Thiobacillus sp.]